VIRIAAALCSALCALPVTAAAQHEHHAVKAVDTLIVRAERNAVRLRSGATVVNARVSAASGGSIADLLRTVPGVELDAEGGIAMRGSTSVLVLMNGTRIPLTGDALIAFLRQMPATALERIEAGSAVSARQDANGAAGVINPVFPDDAARRTVMRSSAGSMATEDHYMGSAAATGSVRDILSWDAMYFLSGLRPRTSSMTSRRTVVPGDLDLKTDQDSRAREKHSLHSILAGAAVTPTANTSLALRGAYSWMEGAYRNRSAYVYTNAAGDRGTTTTGSLLEHVIPTAQLSAVASVERGRVRITSEVRTTATNEDFRGNYDDEVGGYSYLTASMASRQREQVTLSDLGLRFSGISFEVGQESQFRTIRSSHAHAALYLMGDGPRGISLEVLSMAPAARIVRLTRLR
jgi:hypothetical protein